MNSQHIANVAWCWNSFRAAAEYRARGYTDEEILEGCRLGEAMREEHFRNRSWYGDPAYGSWPEYTVKDQPIRLKVLGMMNNGMLHGTMAQELYALNAAREAFLV